MMAEAKKKVLVTGMSGLIGSVLRERLADKVELSALNRSDVPGVPTTRTTIDDLAAIRPAFDGIDTVVHMAAIARMDAGWDELLNANIVGTYNVFEAARQAGVKRVIYASSGATISGWEREEPYKSLSEGRYQDARDGWQLISHLSPTRPAGIYGVTKVFGEALARHYADTTPLSMICLRIGMVNRENKPTSVRAFPNWCSQRDIAQMVERCIFARDDLKFDIFFVTSRNKYSYRDLEHARQVVGYEPQDAAEDYR
jgi:nucleoside-diphosphate-sugar epimerase